MAPNNLEVIGGPANFWLYSNNTGWDLTHSPKPESPLIYPRIPLETTTGSVAIDPKRTALVVIDMQNYFLSPAIGRPADTVGMRVVDKLLETAIPACRKADIPIVWLNWGLDSNDVQTMPPTISKGFAADVNFVDGEKRIGPPGTDIGPLTFDNGTVVEGGRSLMKGEWNTALYDPLAEKADADHDIWVYKNRLSGFWGGTTVEEALHARGTRSFLFSGASTDQCVGGSFQDAFTRGWDCLMLSDACATTSPDYATEMIEYNTAGGWGFLLRTQQFAEGVQNTQATADSES